MIENENRPKVGLCAMIVRDGKVLLGKRKGSHGEGEYAFPGGHMEHGETFLTSLSRELFEETGMKLINATQLSTTNLLRYLPKHYVDVCFLVEALSEPELKEADRCEGWEWHDLNALPYPLFENVLENIKEYGNRN